VTYPLGTDSLRPLRALPPDVRGQDGRGGGADRQPTLAAAIGIALGLIAGVFGGWIDQGVSRLIDVWMAFPPVLLSIVLAAVIGAGLTSVIAAIVVVDWTRFARVVRAETMVQLQRDYAAGSPCPRIEPQPDPAARNPAQSRAPDRHSARRRDGIAILVEVILSFVGILRRRRRCDLGRDDRRGTPDRLPVAPGSWRFRFSASFSESSASIFSAMACGPRSIRFCSEDDRRSCVHDLHVAIGRRGNATNVLRGASLEVGAGEVRGLVGESGAGKSMIGRAVLGLLPANAVIGGGTIRFEGRDLLAMAEPERRSLLGRRIALIPQDPMTSLNPVKRVGAQIAVMLRHHLALVETWPRWSARLSFSPRSRSVNRGGFWSFIRTKSPAGCGSAS